MLRRPLPRFILPVNKAHHAALPGLPSVEPARYPLHPTTAKGQPRGPRWRRSHRKERGALRVYSTSMRARTAGGGALISGALLAPQDVEVQHADALVSVDGMAERADEQRWTPESVGIGGTADVPPEPAVRLVAEQVAQDLTTASGAKLDAADPRPGLATMPGRADGQVFVTVPVEIAGGHDHASEQLPWRAH